MNFLKRVPLPLSGVALGFAALGNLLAAYNMSFKIICGILAFVGLLFVAGKYLSNPQVFATDMKNPVIASVSNEMGTNPYLLFFGLLVGATLGGNITPIGASANIAGIGLLRKEGYEVSFKDFMKIGLPFTVAAVVAGYLFIWFVWR